MEKEPKGLKGTYKDYKDIRNPKLHSMYPTFTKGIRPED